MIEILSSNVSETVQVATYWRRQKRKGSARKARLWEKRYRAMLLRLTRECIRVGGSIPPTGNNNPFQEDA